MSIIISRTFTTTCNGALLENINADANISPLCEQIVNDGTSTTFFYFASTLTPLETSALDAKLASWSCPNLPEVVTSDELFDDTLPPDPDVIWSSDKISDEISNVHTFKTISVSGQSDVVADVQNDTLTLTAGTGIAITTNAATDTITLAATGITGADMAGITLTRSATYTIPTTFTNIVWDVTSIQTDTSIVEHNQINKERVQIKETGIYLIAYSLSVDADAGVGTIDVRMLVNDTSLIPASARQISEDDETNDIGNVFLANLSAGQYITIQIRTTPTGDILIAESTITVVRMRGTKGDKGDQGDPGTGTVTSVAAIPPAAGLTISGSPITTSGTLTFALANDLAAIEALNTSGILTRTGTDTWSSRAINGTSGNIVVTNGDGISGNPTLNLATAGTAGTYATVSTDAFGRVISGSTTQSTATGGTGLTTIGTSDQVLGVNAAGNALEYKTLTAGSGVSITHAANSITIANTGLSFLNFAVSGQSTVVADTTNDTLTLVAGSGMTITTNATTDTITFASTGGSGTPAAPTTSIQFNNAGAFGGTARNVWDNTNNIQTISGNAEQNRLTLYDGSGSVDTTQRANAALYIQVDGDATYEGLRTYFKRSSAGISGWIAYHYDQNTPNIRLTDEDDDAPYISFSTISTGTYDNPLHVSVFGARGTYGSRDNIGDNPGFAWFVGNNTNPAALITAYQPVMELDSQYTTTNKLEGYENGGWADLVQSTGGVFGNNFQQANNDAESSTTSSTFQQKLRMTTPSLPSGTYRIGYSVEGRCNSTSVALAIQVQINDTTTIAEALVESQDVANYDQYNGFYYYTGSGVLNIDIDYRSSSGGTTSFTRRARLEIWRVS